MQRRDGHIHFGDVDVGSAIDPYWYLYEEGTEDDRKKVGRHVHSYKPATIEDMVKRIESEKLVHVCLICDHEAYLVLGAAELAKTVEVSPIYWERNWDYPHIPDIAVGIKIHPMIESRDATVENLRNIMEIARARKIPVLIHSEDENLTRSRGALIAKLAKAYPDVRIVAMHAGAYGAPQFFGKQGYRETLKMLVSEMIAAAVKHPNVYLETSCLAFSEKAKLLFDATCKHPELLDRIIMGSDFPLLEKYSNINDFNTLKHQEKVLKAAGFTNGDIQKFHSNVGKAVPPINPSPVRCARQCAICRDKPFEV